MVGNRDVGSPAKAQILQKNPEGDSLIPTEGMMVFSPISHGGAIQDEGHPARSLAPLPNGQVGLPTCAKALSH